MKPTSHCMVSPPSPEVFLLFSKAQTGQGNTCIFVLALSANRLYNKCEILKFGDQIKLSNFIFAHDSLKRNLPSVYAIQLWIPNAINLVETNSAVKWMFLVCEQSLEDPIVLNLKVQVLGMILTNFLQLIHQSRIFCTDLLKTYIHMSTRF